MITHPFQGAGQACELLLEEPGQPTSYCSRPISHPVHAGVCAHCKYGLDRAAGDGQEACRFCIPHYAGAPAPRRCRPCALGEPHQ